MSQEIPAVDFVDACRLCLCATAECELFQSCNDANKTSYTDMISFLFTFSIEENDKLPSKMCLNCKEQVLSSYKFKIIVENANKQLHYILNETDHLGELVEPQIECREDNVDIELERPPSDSKGDILQCLKVEYDECSINSYKGSSEDSSFSSDEFDEDDNKPLVSVKPLAKASVMKPMQQNPHKLDSTSRTKVATRVDENGKTKYICDLCPKEFTDKSSRRRHRKVQHFGILFYCEICKKSYRSKTSHEAYHRVGKTKTFPCQACDEVFATYYALQCHKKSHTSLPEYACNVCGKKFGDKHLCASHKRRVHDKEKSHQCTFCPKTFFSSHSLKDHITTHTKVRKYDCKECGMLFTTSTILKEHEMRHTGVKPFPCESCEKRFYRKKDLRRHELIHAKSYEHQCTLCGLKFRRKDHLTTHEKGVHRLGQEIQEITIKQENSD